MGQVIGFLNYRDFCDDLMTVPDDLDLVRVQSYFRRSEIGSGASKVEYIVEAAAARDDDLLVCRFRLGGALEWEKRIERRCLGALRAAEILTNDLEMSGFNVGKGLFAAAKASDTEASPDGLWHWTKEDGETVLVPGPAIIGGGEA